MNAFIIDFRSYLPEAWCVGGLLLKNERYKRPTSNIEKRKSNWNILLEKSTLGVGIVGLAVSMGSFVLSEVTLTNLPEMLARIIPKDEKPEKVDIPQILIREINKPFNDLFTLFRSGVPLISSDETRALARIAVQKRDEQFNIEDWAFKLAHDVKDAKD